MRNESGDLLTYTGLPSGTIRRLEALIPKINKHLGRELKSRNELVRVIILEGIADLERDCARVVGALILRHRRKNNELSRSVRSESPSVDS